ncbi:MAG: amidohydrolase family protein [Anaerolineales bacterium]
MAELDLLIREAQLREKPELVDIGIEGGHIAFIGHEAEARAQLEIMAEGRLTSVPFANPHMHLDKVYTLPMLGEEALQAYQGPGMGKAMNAVELAAAVKEDYEPEWILPNARRALALAAVHGCLYVRAFADVDPTAGQAGLQSLLQLQDEFKEILELQVVAFAEDGIVRLPGTAELIRQSMEMGADVVGGHPFIEFTDAAAAEHIREIFAIATQFDAPVSMLVDDAGDPGLRHLEIIVAHALENGWEGRTLTHHARAMSLYPRPYFEKLAALLRRAEIGVVANPHTGPLYTRVRDLLEAGCLVCLGQDDISDAYYPYGRHNMLEVAFLASHLMWMTTKEDMRTLYDMISTKAAQAMGLDLRLAPGEPANLVILREPNLLEALRSHEPPAYVISRGRLVDQAKMQAIIERPDEVYDPNVGEKYA